MVCSSAHGRIVDGQYQSTPSNRAPTSASTSGVSIRVCSRWSGTSPTTRGEEADARRPRSVRVYNAYKAAVEHKGCADLSSSPAPSRATGSVKLVNRTSPTSRDERRAAAGVPRAFAIRCRRGNRQAPFYRTGPDSEEFKVHAGAPRGLLAGFDRAVAQRPRRRDRGRRCRIFSGFYSGTEDLGVHH